MRTLWKRSLLAPYLVVFCYTFLPMMFTLDATYPAKGSGSSASDSEHVAEADKLSVFALQGTPTFTISRSEIILYSNFEPVVERPNYLNYAHAILPVADPTVSSDFGWRVPPCDGCSSDHRGVDFVPGAGEPVRAILAGLVSKAGFNQGYGYWVKLEHIVPGPDGADERWTTVYAHLQADSIPDDVQVGSVVSRGQTIGAVGSTGISTGPHLHFELHVDGEIIDPLPVLAQSQAVKDFTLLWR